MPVDYTREFDPTALMQALGYEADFDSPAKARARAAALRGRPEDFGQESAAGMGGMMLRGPTAAKVSDALYRSGERGKQNYAEQVNTETERGREARRTALTATMQNMKDKRAEDWKGKEFDAEQGYRAQTLALQRAQEARLAAAEKAQWSAIADPITGEIVLYNKMTGEKMDGQQGGGGPRDPDQMPLFNPQRGMKPTEKMKNDLTSIQQQRASVQGALEGAKGNPNAFGLKQGALERFGGDVGTAFAQWKRNPMDTATRAYVLNNVSTIINERAGAAQSVQELARLRGFLPSETDDAAHVEAKFNAFLDYLDEREAATRGYSSEELGYKPRTHGAGAQGGEEVIELPSMSATRGGAQGGW